MAVLIYALIYKAPGILRKGPGKRYKSVLPGFSLARDLGKKS